MEEMNKRLQIVKNGFDVTQRAVNEVLLNGEPNGGSELAFPMPSFVGNVPAQLRKSTDVINEFEEIMNRKPPSQSLKCKRLLLIVLERRSSL